MAKAEVSWKRLSEDGDKQQIYARQIGGEWFFFRRHRRYDEWQPMPEPPLEDWLELLDAMRRMIPRRRFMPKDEDHLMRRIHERFPDADLGPAQFPP